MRFLRNFFLPTYANNYRAYLISNKALLFYTIILIATNLFFSGPGVQRTYALIDAGSVIELHNRERQKHGLGPLKSNYVLHLSAKAKGEAMLQHDCWSHYCPPGTSPWKFFQDKGYVYAFAGENLAEGFSNNEAVMQAWMNSQTHRENVLKPEFTEIGVALVTGDFQGIKNNIIVVVHFGRPRNAAPANPANISGNKANTNPNKGANSSGGSSNANKSQSPTTPPSKPSITKPLQDGFVNNAKPEITGKADRGVIVELGGQRSGRVDPDGGIFTYRSDAELEDGQYNVKATDHVDNSLASEEVAFTVDKTTPELNTDANNLLFVGSSDANDEGTGTGSTEITYNLGLNFSEPITELSLVARNNPSMHIDPEDINGTAWQVELVVPDGSDLSSYLGDLQVTAKDRAGNILQQDITSAELRELEIKSLGLDSLPVTGSAQSIFMRTLSSSWQRITNLSPAQLLPLAMVVLLLLLFIIDYFVINKTDLKLGTKLRDNSHFHIPALAILAILIIMGSVGASV